MTYADLAASASDTRIKVLCAMGAFMLIWIGIAFVCEVIRGETFAERRRRRNAFVASTKIPDDSRSSILQFRKSHQR